MRTNLVYFKPPEPIRAREVSKPNMPAEVVAKVVLLELEFAYTSAKNVAHDSDSTFRPDVIVVAAVITGRIIAGLDHVRKLLAERHARLVAQDGIMSGHYYGCFCTRFCECNQRTFDTHGAERAEHLWLIEHGCHFLALLLKHTDCRLFNASRVVIGPEQNGKAKRDAKRVDHCSQTCRPKISPVLGIVTLDAKLANQIALAFIELSAIQKDKALACDCGVCDVPRAA